MVKDQEQSQSFPSTPKQKNYVWLYDQLTDPNHIIKAEGKNLFAKGETIQC